MIGPILGGYKRVNFDPAQYAMTGDGNSIMDPYYSDLLTQLAALPPINNQIVISNCGVSGQSIISMSWDHTDVDEAFVAGKVNFLLIFELTNNIYNSGRTGLETISDLQDYMDAVTAVHPWRMILMTGIPRGGSLGSTWDAVTGEEQMEIANAYIRANWRAMGAVALVEARRAGGPFDFTDCTDMANFPSSIWSDQVHPNSAGKAILAGYIADVLKRLPAR